MPPVKHESFIGLALSDIPALLENYVEEEDDDYEYESDEDVDHWKPNTWYISRDHKIIEKMGGQVFDLKSDVVLPIDEKKYTNDSQGVINYNRDRHLREHGTAEAARTFKAEVKAPYDEDELTIRAGLIEMRKTVLASAGAPICTTGGDPGSRVVIVNAEGVVGCKKVEDAPTTRICAMLMTNIEYAASFRETNQVDMKGTSGVLCLSADPKQNQGLTLTNQQAIWLCNLLELMGELLITGYTVETSKKERRRTLAIYQLAVKTLNKIGIPYKMFYSLDQRYNNIVSSTGYRGLADGSPKKTRMIDFHDQHLSNVKVDMPNWRLALYDVGTASMRWDITGTMDLAGVAMLLNYFTAKRSRGGTTAWLTKAGAFDPKYKEKTRLANVANGKLFHEEGRGIFDPDHAEARLAGSSLGGTIAGNANVALQQGIYKPEYQPMRSINTKNQNLWGAVLEKMDQVAPRTFDEILANLDSYPYLEAIGKKLADGVEDKTEEDAMFEVWKTLIEAHGCETDGERGVIVGGTHKGQTKTIAALSGLGYTKYLAFEYIRNCPCADVPGAKVREQKKKRDEKKT